MQTYSIKQGMMLEDILEILRGTSFQWDLAPLTGEHAGEDDPIREWASVIQWLAETFPTLEVQLGGLSAVFRLSRGVYGLVRSHSRDRAEVAIALAQALSRLGVSTIVQDPADSCSIILGFEE